MRNPYMKIQNPSMNGSWWTDARTDRRMDEQTERQPETNMPHHLLRSMGHKNIFFFSHITVLFWIHSNSNREMEVVYTKKHISKLN